MSLAEQGKYGRGRTLAIRRWLVYSLAGLFAFLILAVLYIWVQRYALLETALRNQLSARGIDAELRIEHADWTRAVVRDLKLRDGSEIFFSSDRIVVDYQWRDAIRGRVNYVEIHKPHARATLDASGRIQDTWYLKQIRNSGDASGMDLPARGIVVRHGRFDITSPYGRVTGTVSGDFKSMDDVTADMDLEPSNMSFGDFSATLSGSAKFTLSPDVNQGTSRIEPDIVIGDWRYGDFSGERVQLAGQADVVRSDSGVTMSGDISANSRAMDFGYLRLDSGTAGWSGTLEMQDRNGGGTVLDGFWQGQFTGVTVMDDERRRNMAEAVTMYKALSVSPIVRNFAETLTLDIQNLMVDGEVSTKAHVSKSGADTVVSLDGPLTWSSGNRRLTLEQGTDMPFYTFDPVGKIITLDFNGNFDGRHAVSFESGKLVMGPQTGDSRTGLGNFRIQGFNSIVQTAGIWRRTLPDRRSVRLAPVRASVDYVNLDHDRRLTVSGAIDYDGEIPGGYVKGLNMQGQLDLDLTGPTKVGYAPTRGTRISIDEFQSVAGWHGRNIGFDLRDTKELYVQNPDGSGVLGVEVSRGTAEFVRIGTPQKINLGYGKASVIADINARGQNWRMDGQDVVMTSDTVPGPGTRMEAEELSLTVNMQKGDRLQFSLETSGAAAKTQLVDAHDFRITGGGTATDYTFNYADGRVKFPAAQWPVLPVSGSVRFADGQWSGDAVTFLPLAETSPINVVYMFRDRQGTARVDIVDLPFHPSALQPQHLIPALQGRVADVRGRASAQIDLIFGAG
ncbi:MAG: hypothetical protein GDA39_00415, partial [Hyphomonadaceae bacterium]|nr:hypothetical protein [Hyphomonadaceae bacterium]